MMLSREYDRARISGFNEKRCNGNAQSRNACDKHTYEEQKEKNAHWAASNCASSVRNSFSQ